VRTYINLLHIDYKYSTTCTEKEVFHLRKLSLSQIDKVNAGKNNLYAYQPANNHIRILAAYFVRAYFNPTVRLIPLCLILLLAKYSELENVVKLC